MTWIADAGLWVAVVLVGLVAGLLAPRPGTHRTPAFTEWLLLAGAAATVAAWCAHAGQLIGSPSSSALLMSRVPIAVAPGYRLAVLWATLPGGALTLAAILLVRLALSSEIRSAANPAGIRQTFIVTVMALTALGIAAWFAPDPLGTLSIPPFVQSGAAAAAPLQALLAFSMLAWAVPRALVARTMPRSELLVAWTFATAAVAAEQVARSQLGVGPSDPIVFVSASSGLLLWLGASALLHNAIWRRLGVHVATRDGSRSPARLAHAGAALLIASFGLHAAAARHSVSLPPGRVIEVSDSFRRPWRLVNQGVSLFQDADAEVTSLVIDATMPSGRSALLMPEVREYHGPDGQHLDNAIVRRASAGGLLQTLRVLFTTSDSLDVARVRVTFLPAPFLWPLGVALVILSAILAFTSLAPSNEERDA